MPEKATMKTSNILDFCDEISDEVQVKPVLTLTKNENGETSGHAVVLKSYQKK